MKDFHDYINEMQVYPIHSFGGTYTWSNKDGLLSTIYYIFGNDVWKDIFLTVLCPFVRVVSLIILLLLCAILWPLSSTGLPSRYLIMFLIILTFIMLLFLAGIFLIIIGGLVTSGIASSVLKKVFKIFILLMLTKLMIRLVN